MKRNWTPIEGDPRWEDEDYYNTVRAQCDALAKWWSVLYNESEQEYFRSLSEDADWCPGEEPPQPRWYEFREHDPEYLADLEAYEKEIAEWEHSLKVQVKMREAQMDFCEQELERLGARIMRPYEHWNEEEAYMEYAERDRN